MCNASPQRNLAQRVHFTEIADTFEGASPRSFMYGWAEIAVKLGIILMLTVLISHAQNATTTSLNLSSTNVSTGTVVTMTATVSNGSPVAAGSVLFCDAIAPSCQGLAAIAQAQLTGNGTAIVKLRAAPGVHSYKAVFPGTLIDATSSSAPQSLTVSETYSNGASMSAGGTAGNYTLTGTVTTPNRTALPTGVIDFVDTTTSYALGTASLGSGVTTQQFGAQESYTVGIHPQAVVQGDFNNDGYVDLAVSNSTSSSVSILIGNGDGTFQAAVPYAASSISRFLAVGDLNSDGNADLAVVDFGSSTISILLGVGDGTFLGKVTYPVGNGPGNLAIADFNSDGALDLAVTNSASSDVSILLGIGDGTFQAQSAFTTGTNPGAIVARDFDGDGKLDLAIANAGSNDVTILNGNGDGTFAPPVSYAAGFGSVGFAAEDFDGDGILDLAIANAISNDISILIGVGNGTFVASVSYPVGNNPKFVTTGDFDGDGKVDLAASNEADSNLSILIGNGNGTFKTQVTYPTGTVPTSIAVADFDGDGNIDLAITNWFDDQLGVLLNQVKQTVTAVQSGISIPGSGTHQIRANYTGDGNFSQVFSTTTGLTASAIATVLTLSANPATSNYADSIELTATLSPSAAGSLNTQGQPITFYNGAVSIGTGNLNSGTATLILNSLPSGTASLTASFSGNSDFILSTSSPISFVVHPVTPTVTWAAPAAISYGVALDSAQLNATASVPGSFSYSPDSGTLLNAGARTLSVTFTPADSANYSPVLQNVSITVNPAAASAIPDPKTKVYGAEDPSFSGTLSGFVSTDHATATYSRDPGESVDSGPYNISAHVHVGERIVNYSVTYNTASFTITKASLSASANNTSMVVGRNVPELLGTLTGVVAGDGITATYSTTATSLSGVGTYPISITLNDPNQKLSNYSTALTNATLTVSKASSTITLLSSDTEITIQNSIMLTATVASNGGIPSGSVNFFDGAVSMGVASLDSAGKTTLTVSNLSVGSHSLSATFAGNTDIAESTSDTIVQAVEDFNFAVNGNAPAAISASTIPGGQANFTLQMSPAGGSTFPDSVTFTLTGLPVGSTYSITPSIIPAGSPITSVTVTVTAPLQNAAAFTGSNHFFFGLALIALLPLIGFRKLMGKRQFQRALVLATVLLTIALLVGMTACGDGLSGSSAKSPQTYPLSLTATSGGMQHSVVLNLTVE